MFYKIKLEKKASQFISKLDVQEKERVKTAIDNLKESPFPRNKKHILSLNGSSMLCELAVSKLRIYYTIENQFVVVENIEYKGIITILEGKRNHKSGNKKNPNQQKDIQKLKKKFSSN